MKQRRSKSYASGLKIGSLAIVLVTVSVLLFSFSVDNKLVDDVWKQLGLSKADGINSIKESFQSNYLQYYSARNFKKIATGNRAAVAKDLLAQTKAYINSPAFQKEYSSSRLASKPMEPEYKAIRTKAEIQKEEVERIEKSIKDAEEMNKKMTPEVQKGVQEGIDLQKKTLKEFQNPNHKLWGIMLEADINENKWKADDYKRNVERWEKDYPTDAKVIIKQRLQKLLEVTADIDYDAELKEKYGKKVFVNATYERKPDEWKMGFRAGKEVTETTRAFVEKWLAELK